MRNYIPILYHFFFFFFHFFIRISVKNVEKSLSFLPLSRWRRLVCASRWLARPLAVALAFARAPLGLRAALSAFRRWCGLACATAVQILGARASARPAAELPPTQLRPPMRCGAAPRVRRGCRALVWRLLVASLPRRRLPFRRAGRSRAGPASPLCTQNTNYEHLFFLFCCFCFGVIAKSFEGVLYCSCRVAAAP